LINPKNQWFNSPNSELNPIKHNFDFQLPGQSNLLIVWKAAMPELNCDLQLHGRFASGVSKNLQVPLMAEFAQWKGLQVLVTGDVQHKDWLAHLKEQIVETENGVFCDLKNRVSFIVGTEVEDQNRIHHLVYLPDFSRAEDFREKIKPFGNLDCSMCGRPILRRS